MTNQPKFSGYFQAFLAALMTFTCGMSAFIRQWFIDKRESVLGVAIACIGFGGAAGTWLFGVLDSRYGFGVTSIAFACLGVLLPTLAEQQGDWTVPLLLAIGMMVVAIIMGLLAMQLAPMRKLHVLTCHHHGGTIGM